MRRFAGVVLAGGRGERFGGPKALAALPDGRTFLQACCQTLEASGADPVLATVPPASEVAAPAGVTILRLPRPGLEMFDSLRLALSAALEHGGWQAAVILPVDHPLVAADTVRDLAAAPGQAVRPVFAGKRGHPIVLSRAVTSGIVSGELAGPTLREVLREVDAVDVAVKDRGVTLNCNTPGSLAAALGVAE
jgi:CTP:molybdopterin cytidylyltransferase MocA